MIASGPKLEIAVRQATEVLDIYRSREFWEDQFRDLGLWPEMLRYDPISQRNSDAIDTVFLNFQLVATLRSNRDRVAGIAQAVPLCIGGSIADLPDTGWDWALSKAASDQSHGTVPDAICGLSITVLPEFQRRGVGRSLIEEVVQLAMRERFQNVVMPVRPISKREYPSVSMEEFLTWRRNDGFHSDAWIRSHEVAGGIVQKACNRSMTVPASISDWERWCGRKLQESGTYVVKEGLALVTIDIDKGVGCYEEPNVWVVHPCL